MTAALPEAEQLASAATRLLAVAQAEPRAGTTRGESTSLRYAKNSDLKHWITSWAEANGISTNRAILLAIEALRAAVESGREREHTNGADKRTT